MSNIIEIKSFLAPELDIFARLTENQLRSRIEPEKGIFIAESPKVITLALDYGYEPISLLMEQKHITGDGREIIARCNSVPVYTAEASVLERLTGYRLTRGVLCAMRRPLQLSFEQVCNKARRLAVLDGVVDSTNIGAIFRSAAALGMDGVLLTRSCCDPFCRRAVRVSMGTVFQIPWTWMEDTNGLEYLKRMGFKTVAMALDEHAFSIDSQVLRSLEKLAIVLGAEGNGLTQQTIDSCDYTAVIPMYHNVDSLNVAAASAVAFWELSKEMIGNR